MFPILGLVLVGDFLTDFLDTMFESLLPSIDQSQI